MGIGRLTGKCGSESGDGAEPHSATGTLPLSSPARGQSSRDGWGPLGPVLARSLQLMFPGSLFQASAASDF